MSKTTFDKVRMSSLEVQEPLTLKGATVFDEQLTASYTPDVSINPTYGLTSLRLIQETTGTGAITEDGGAFKISTGATASSTANIETAEVGDYNPGSMAVGGILVFRPTPPTGEHVAQWGYFDADNGFIFEEGSTGWGVRLRSGGTDGDLIRQKDFNADKLDGTGPSGFTIDLSLPHIFRIRMALYGQGPAEMHTIVVDDKGVGHKVVVHRFSVSQSKIILEQWGLPLRARVENGSTALDFTLYVGGMQFGVIGKRVDKPRTTSETVFGKTLDGTTIVPIVSFRKKTTGKGINVRVLGYTPVSSDNLQILIITNGSLTGASFGSFTNVSDAETALEVDTSATAITGGEARYEDLHTGGGGNKLEVSGPSEIGSSLPRDTVITLAARLLTGSGGSGTFAFRAEEDW